MAKERLLLMGPPATGKTRQLLNVVLSLEEQNTPVYVIDLEDKLKAMLEGLNISPTNMTLYTAFDWDEEPIHNESDGGFKQVVNIILNKCKPSNWIMVDRIDLAWPMVQRWFTQEKYNEELADRLLKKSKKMTVESSRFTPRFDQGAWQVVNEQYESQILKILYKSRCNILFTTGIKGIEKDAPVDIYENLGVLPRGQKELGHQPHSVFLLTMQKEGRDLSWQITTGKDLPNREWFDRDELWDFSIQYLSLYYQP